MDVITQPIFALINNNILFGQLLPKLPYILPQIDPKISSLLFSVINSVILLAFVIGTAFILLNIIYKVLITLFKLKQEYTLLEVKPLRITEQSALSTQQLFTLIHGLSKQRTFLERLFQIPKTYGFEIVSSKDQGIRYLMRVNKEDEELIRKSLLSYLPGVSIKETTDYLPKEDFKARITEFRLAKHFAFPLKKQDDLDEHDPIAYITGNMTKLEKDELVSFQLVVSPLNKGSNRQIKKVNKLLYNNIDLLTNLKTTSISQFVIYLPSLILKYTLLAVIFFLMLPIGVLVFASTGGREGPFLTLPLSSPPKKTNNPYQQELERIVKEKIDQQLFTTSMRVLLIGNNYNEARRRQRGFVSALASFSNASYQALIPNFNLKLNLFQKLKAFTFKNRLLGFFGNSILSISEVTDLYHFPYTSTTKTEDLVKQHSKQLPAPLSLKRANNLDIIFAKNTYGGNTTMIGLNEEERRRHMYIIGATGTGKSTLLLSMINQDIKNGKGLAVIDPHGDLIEKVLPIIPEERLKDVIYFNPDDVAYPIGINLLELSTGLSEDDALREKEFITESIISLFHKLYTDKYSGPRMEYILRNTIHTAFTYPGSTLFTVYKLLINTPFRKQVTAQLTDENLKDFWKYEFSKAGDYQKVKMISPITNKIGRFLFSPVVKRILEQEKSSINFDDIMDSGKILLCNLSKGRIGEDTSNVFGVLLMTKIQLAALKRARKDIENRRDFYLYVDEFQNFATPAFAQILSEARKYRLNAILAHQTTSQLEDKSLVHVTLANTGTIICFRTANPEDEKLILPQFQPYIQQGEIANLPSFNFYMKNNALNPEEPFSGETILIQVNSNKGMVEKVIKLSREQYTKPYTVVSSTAIKKSTPRAKKQPVSEAVATFESGGIVVNN